MGERIGRSDRTSRARASATTMDDAAVSFFLRSDAAVSESESPRQMPCHLFSSFVGTGRGTFSLLFRSVTGQSCTVPASEPRAEKRKPNLDARWTDSADSLLGVEIGGEEKIGLQAAAPLLANHSAIHPLQPPGWIRARQGVR
jgi:hypothetical protein